MKFNNNNNNNNGNNRKQVDYNYNSHQQNEQYELSQNANEHNMRPLDRGPIFELTASKNVTGLVGKTNHLNCRIRNIGNKTVSTNNIFNQLRIF